MENFDLSRLPNVCNDLLQLFSEDSDLVAETLFLGLYFGPNDQEIIRKTILELDKREGPGLERKIDIWTLDRVNISDIHKLNLSSRQASLLAFRLENARDSIPQLLGNTFGGHPTYDLQIRAAAESFLVQWALTAFWSLTKDAYADYESRYLSDVLAERS